MYYIFADKKTLNLFSVKLHCTMYIKCMHSFYILLLEFVCHENASNILAGMWIRIAKSTLLPGSGSVTILNISSIFFYKTKGCISILIFFFCVCTFFRVNNNEINGIVTGVRSPRNNQNISEIVIQL